MHETNTIPAKRFAVDRLGAPVAIGYHSQPCQSAADTLMGPVRVAHFPGDMSEEASDSIVWEKGKGRVSAIVTAVRLAEVFVPDLIAIGLEQRTKQGVIAELVRRLASAEHVEPDNEAALIQLIMAREEMGSTALGNGVAMPHCRTSLTDRFIGAIAIDANGVDFGALDRQAVHLVFLLLAPLDQRERLYDILGRISSLRQDKTIRTQFRGCRSREDVTAILQELDGFRDDLKT